MFKSLIVSVLCFFSAVWAQIPDSVYLTYVHNPAHSVGVHWILNKKEEGVLYFQEEGEGKWHLVEAQNRLFQEGEGCLCFVELKGLKAGERYAFRIGEEEKLYYFRTVGEEGVQFVVGGDAYLSESLFNQMNEVIAAHEPDFVVIGGDIAYAIGTVKGVLGGREWEMSRWKEFFRKWEETMVKKNGDLIPLVPVVGNHDVRQGEGGHPEKQGAFYRLFSFPEGSRAYRVLDVGDGLTLFLLDSGHTFPVEGRQTEWLKKALEERENKQWKMAVYHVAAFPSYYPYGKSISKKIRASWSPLFEEYGVCVAFEHHNHCYKRTYPLRNERVDATGVVYLGDGSWGVSPRGPVRGAGSEFLAKTEKINSCFLVKIIDSQLIIKALSNKNIEFDKIEIIK